MTSLFTMSLDFKLPSPPPPPCPHTSPRAHHCHRSKMAADGYVLCFCVFYALLSRCGVIFSLKKPYLSIGFLWWCQNKVAFQVLGITGREELGCVTVWWMAPAIASRWFSCHLLPVCSSLLMLALESRNFIFICETTAPATVMAFLCIKKTCRNYHASVHGRASQRLQIDNQLFV